MTHSLFIRFIAEAVSDTAVLVDWVLLNSDGSRIDGGSVVPLVTLEEQLSAQPTPQTIVLIPAQDVLQTSLHIPAAQKRHLQRTLPFLVEEHIATPIEEMHLSSGNLHNYTATVFGISHSRMQFWQQLLKQHDIRADTMLPDNILGNLTAGELKIVIDNECASFHYPEQPVISAPLSNLSFIADSYLASLQQQQHASATLILADNLSQTNSAAAQALATQLDVEGLATRTETTASCFETRCASMLHSIKNNPMAALPNLQSARYQVTTDRQRRDAPNWRAIAVVIALCIAFKLVFDLGTGLYLDYQTRQVDDQITALYRELFPQDRKIINAKVQMQNHLNEQGSGLNSDGFVALFSQLAKALRDTEVSLQAQVQQLRYNDNTQTLLLDIQVQKVDQLEQLKQALKSNNIKAAILSANEEQQWVRGRVRLSL